MPLNPMSFSDNMLGIYSSFCSVEPDGTANNKGSSGDFASGFASAYDAYAQEGMVIGTMPGGDPSPIEAYLRTGGTLTDFATALAQYWASAHLEPGPPMHGGMAHVSVANDAMAYVADFEAAIKASITSSKSTPFYMNFAKNVQDMAVSKIIWTVTELMPSVPPAPTPFPEPIT